MPRERREKRSHSSKPRKFVERTKEKRAPARARRAVAPAIRPRTGSRGAIAGGPLSGDIAPLYVGHALDGPGGGRYRRPFVVMLAAPVGDTRRFPRALVIGALLLA